jgi:hypothetical protein
MHSRNAGLQRLRSITKRIGVAAAVLTGVFAGIAAAGNSGKQHRRTAHPATSRPTANSRVPAPPSLPPVAESGSAPAAPSAPQQPPLPSQAPPAAVSGGS